MIVNQQQAAEILDIGPRTLRDMSAPRLPSGEYDLKALVGWWRGRPARAATLSDQQRELVIQVAEQIDGAIEASRDAVASLVRDLGGGVEAFSRVIAEAIRDHSAWAADHPEASKVSARDFRPVGYFLQCVNCGRVRRGPKWITGVEIPTGADRRTEESCPGCESQQKGGKRTKRQN